MAFTAHLRSAGLVAILRVKSLSQSMFPKPVEAGPEPDASYHLADTLKHGVQAICFSSPHQPKKPNPKRHKWKGNHCPKQPKKPHKRPNSRGKETQQNFCPSAPGTRQTPLVASMTRAMPSVLPAARRSPSGCHRRQ